ncbi:MAG: thiamine-phosphate kinase [Kiritimatiellae bacterium]|nr:thiamine-phosphate kinase [Kiritimatiellia bacterium]
MTTEPTGHDPSHPPPQTLGQLGERAVIARLTRLLSNTQDVRVGPGDDCAVVRSPTAGDDLLLTSDPVIEGAHFLPGTAPEAIGHKAIGRVLSDIAAMGGEPQWALVDVVAPRKTAVAKLEKIYAGMLALARTHGLALVGGDTSEGECLALHAFGVGRVAEGRAILRSGAEPGDAVYVTGALGGSGRGRHLSFEPRVREGAWLGKRGWAKAMIDVSDGLATDLAHLCAMSRTGAVILEDRIPIAPAARDMEDGRSAVAHALGDGEDFELLFAVEPDGQPAFEAAWRAAFELPCTFIGALTEQRGILECVDAAGNRRTVSSTGFEHFA